jgi:hypothetical protein
MPPLPPIESSEESTGASLLIRGRGSQDPPRSEDQSCYDVFVTNQSDQILSVELPAGMLLVPAGQTAPRLPATFARVLAAAASSPGADGQTLSYAIWAARGFTRADVEQTLMRRVTDAEALLVQRWLDYVFLPVGFDRGSEIYAQLARESVRRLARVVPFRGTAELASGDQVQVECLTSRGGRAVVTLQSSQGGGCWRYAARITAQRPGQVALALRHLHTQLPLDPNSARLWVTLTPSAVW